MKIVSQVRITVFDDGLEGKDLPTGFNADVEGELWLLFKSKSRKELNLKCGIKLLTTFQ